jgi:hypothetical protein
MPNAPDATQLVVLDPVLKEYESALRVPLRVRCPRRPFSKPIDASGFHLHLFAVPRRLPWLSLTGETPMVTLPMAFGHMLDESARWALTLPRRMRIGAVLRDAEGRPLAYLLDRNIFVLFDLAGQSDELAPLLLRQLLDHAFDMMTTDLATQSGQHPDRIRATLASLRRTTDLEEMRWRGKRTALARTSFLEGRSERIEDEIGFLEAEIRSTEEALEGVSRHLTTETRHLQASRRRLRQLKGESDRDEVDVAREFQRLSELPDVADVTALADGLRIITHPVTVEHEGRLHALGTFQVDLSYSGQITIRNLTNRHGFYDHPHIWDGKPCLGNIREGLAKLIGELQLAAAAEVVLDFVNTVSPKDWHVSIEHWREIDRAGRGSSVYPDGPKPAR